MKRNYSKGLLATLAFLGCGVAQQAWADKVVTSTADSPKWFQIVAKREKRLMTDNGVGQNMTGAVNTTDLPKTTSGALSKTQTVHGSS